MLKSLRLTKRGWARIACAIASLLALIFFFALAFTAPEEGENIALIGIMTGGALLGALALSFHDYWHIPSLLTTFFTSFAFFLIVQSRVDYLAYYLAGDVHQTGLSAFLIFALIFALIAFVMALTAAISSKGEATLSRRKEEPSTTRS